jgi:hypothetical protein
MQFYACSARSEFNILETEPAPHFGRDWKSVESAYENIKGACPCISFSCFLMRVCGVSLPGYSSRIRTEAGRLAHIMQCDGKYEYEVSEGIHSGENHDHSERWQKWMQMFWSH